MKTKKIAAVLLTCIVAIGLMAGCGASNTNQSASNNDSQSISTNQSGNEEADTNSENTTDTTENTSTGNGKTLVVYYSASGNTKDVAEKIAKITEADLEHLVACDYVGIVSANKEADKMKKAGFTTTKGEFVNAPIINELPLTLECELVKVIDGSKYLAEIKNVSADEKYLGDDGEIDLSKFTPITYDPVHHGYYRLGERVGNAFKDGTQLK